MKKVLLTNWHPSRIFRVAAGVVAVIYAILQHDSMLGLAGGFLLFMGMTNTVCCGVGGCDVTTSKKTDTIKPEQIHFEEVK